MVPHSKEWIVRSFYMFVSFHIYTFTKLGKKTCKFFNYFFKNPDFFGVVSIACIFPTNSCILVVLQTYRPIFFKNEDLIVGYFPGMYQDVSHTYWCQICVWHRYFGFFEVSRLHSQDTYIFSSHWFSLYLFSGIKL